MNSNALLTTLQRNGVNIDKSGTEPPQLLSFFTPMERQKKIKWQDSILEIRTEGDIEFLITSEIDEFEIKYKGPVNEQTMVNIENALIDDDVTNSKLEINQYFADHLIFKKTNHWNINGKRMIGKHLYEAIYEYITGEIVELEEYLNIKKISTNFKKNK